MSDPAINVDDLAGDGVQFSIQGERGRFTYRHLNLDGSVHAWGGLPGRERARDFRVERITKVHQPKNHNKKENHQ